MVTVRNIGGANLTIRKVTIEGAGFSKQADNCSSMESIAPNNSCTIRIGFTPESEDNFTGKLRIASNAIDKIIFLNGTGIPRPETPSEGEPPHPSCPHKNLGTFTHNGIIGTSRTEIGTMDINSCKSYSLTIAERGDLAIFITPGYNLVKSQIIFTDTTRFEHDPTTYKRYGRLYINAMTSINDIRIIRTQDSPKDFKFIFKLYPR